MSKTVFQEKPREIEVPAPHDCADFATATFEGTEVVCIRCGAVLPDETEQLLYEQLGVNGRFATSWDHNAGNDLLNSVTPQAGYVSRADPGLMFKINGRARVMNDPYKSGLLADPSKGCHIEECVLTGKKSLKFSKYDLPTLQLMKEKALGRAISLKLDTVEQTLVSKELQRIYSNLVMSDITDYAVLVALLSQRHNMSDKAAKALDKELVACVEKIRKKIVSGCAPASKAQEP